MQIVLQLFVALVVIGIVEYTAALQCYTCDNCLDEEELAVLQICGASTTRRPRPTTTPTTTTTKGASKKTTTTAYKTTRGPNNSDYDEDDYSDDDDDIGDEKPVVTTRKTTLRPATKRTTTKKSTAATTTLSHTDDDDDDSEDDYYDDDDFRRRRRRRQVRPVPRVNEAVCYMIQVRVNGSVVTKRGCTAMRPNNILTCHSLHDNNQPMEDCQLCDTNLCNKFELNNMDYLPLWNGATPSASAARWLVGLALTALLMRHSN